MSYFPPGSGAAEQYRRESSIAEAAMQKAIAVDEEKPRETGEIEQQLNEILTALGVLDAATDKHAQAVAGLEERIANVLSEDYPSPTAVAETGPDIAQPSTDIGRLLQLIHTRILTVSEREYDRVHNTDKITGRVRL